MTSPTGSPIADKILAISTSGRKGSLALGGLQVDWDKKAMHSELATVKLQELLEQTRLQLSDLKHIAVNIGPGSFTGIRVGINLARTLAYALSIPVTSFNALSLLAARHLPENERGFVAIKAVQNFYYAATYVCRADALLEVHPPQSVEQTQITELSQGCTKVLIEEQTPQFSTEIDAHELIQWLGRWPNSKPFFPWKDVKPLYIRGSEAEEKLRRGLLKPL